MKIGVIMISFGEPAEPTREQVEPFLERIFFQNAPLEGGDEGARRSRAKELAQKRAPGLIAEYEEIGGSPLTTQANSQARATESLLRSLGHDAIVYPAFQFTQPTIDAQVARAGEDGCGVLVALPVYPLCGPSTTVAALREFRQAVESVPFAGEALEIGGWHNLQSFGRVWVGQIDRYLTDESLRFDGDTALVFSAHGTPTVYLEGGSRYDRYVEELCAAVASGLGVNRYYLGFQNHTNRPIAWTKPDVETVIEELSKSHQRVVVVPIAFLHEQSETLSELDIELRGEAEERGLEFHRVPVPQDSRELIELFAGLVISRAGQPAPEPSVSPGLEVEWRQCVCGGGGGIARCTNGLHLTSRRVVRESS